jgi:hypothetical protein
VIARALLLFAIALSVHAQMALRPFGAGAMKGTVVDADTGRPLGGAVVVARWNWLDYSPGGFHSSARHHDLGEVLHIAEAVSDAEGRFVIPGFATVRGKGSLKENAPSVTVFASGYEPFQRDVGGEMPGIRLKRHSGPPADLAAKIGAAQGTSSQGLYWLAEKTDWKSMPRMVEALHREKVRLGDQGVEIRSAHRLAGLSASVAVVDAATGRGVQAADKLPGEPYARGAVWTAWTMRRTDGSPGTMRLTYSRTLVPGEVPSNATLSPWVLPGPDTAVPGWEAVKDVPPQVRVYAWGYRRSAEQRWTEANATVKLARVPAQREPVVENVRALRRDIDAELASNREQAIENHRPLLALLDAECRALTPDLREGLCFPVGSDVATALAKRDAVARFDRIPEDGPKSRYNIGAGKDGSRLEPQRIEAAAPAVAASRGSALGGASMYPSAGGGAYGHGTPAAGQRPRVGGFSIEPAR